MGGDKDPVSVSSGPDSGLKQTRSKKKFAITIHIGAASQVETGTFQGEQDKILWAGWSGQRELARSTMFWNEADVETFGVKVGRLVLFL